MPPRSTALAVLVTAIWGTNFVALHEGLSGVPPLWFAGVRFVLLLIPAIFLVPRPPVPARKLAEIGATLSLGQFALLYLGLKAGVPAGLASLVLQTQVPITVALAALVLHERPTPRQLIGLAIGGAGLGLIALGRAAATPLGGLALLVAAATSWACGNVLTRRLGTASGLGLTVWSALVVPVPMFVLSYLVEGPAQWRAGVEHWGWPQSWSTLYTVYLSSLVGYGIWNSLLARHQARAVVPFALLVPLFGIAAALVFLHEMPSPFEALGGAVLLLGAAVTVLPQRVRTTAGT